MLVSDTGSVYAFGTNNFRVAEVSEAAHDGKITTPQIVKSMKGIFVVQAAIGGYFSAILTREGQVYTFSWGQGERIGHNSDPSCVQPRLLPGLEDAPVAHISAGTCYLLMLAYQPNGMSMYSVGCGLGGKLAHGCKNNKGIPKLIEHFRSLSFKPVSVSPGTWHAAALGEDGHVCTWGWGHRGCLGNVKAVYLSAGDYITFVVADNGDVHSFGSGESLNEDDDAEVPDLLTPSLVGSLKALNKKIAQISPTNASYWLNLDLGHSHTFAVLESGNLYAFGGVRGQLGVKLADGLERVNDPKLVPIDLH